MSLSILLCIAGVAAIAGVAMVVSRNRGASMSAGRAVCPISPGPAERRGLAWLIGAFVLCPCHLPLSLALVATLLSGTALGALVSGHRYVAVVVITSAWLAGTLQGIRYWRSARIRPPLGTESVSQGDRSSSDDGAD